MNKETHDAGQEKKMTAWLEVRIGDQKDPTVLNMGKEPAQNGSRAFSNGTLSLFIHPDHKGIYLQEGQGENKKSTRVFLNEGEAAESKKAYFFLGGKDNGKNVTVNLHGNKEVVDGLKDAIRQQSQLGLDDDVARKAKRATESKPAAEPAAPKRRRQP